MVAMIICCFIQVNILSITEETADGILCPSVFSLKVDKSRKKICWLEKQRQKQSLMFPHLALLM